jgi:hypothetical protein
MWQKKCTLKIRRDAGGGDFSGISVVLKESYKSNRVIFVLGNIKELETASIIVTKSEEDIFDFESITGAEIRAYSIDESGKKINCLELELYGEFK